MARSTPEFPPPPSLSLYLSLFLPHSNVMLPVLAANISNLYLPPGEDACVVLTISEGRIITDRD